MNLCPACGCEIGEPAWSDGYGCLEICDCCGLQFGYQDTCGGRADLREGFYLGWRVRWISEGHPWHSRVTRPPKDWSTEAQLARIPDIAASTEARADNGGERVTLLRTPDGALDDVFVSDVSMFRAEMLDRDHLWLC